jgi:hypothetical protein
MNIKTSLILVLISAFTLISIDRFFGATIPASTTLMVRTLNAISSQDRAGKTFTAQLEQNVVVDGKVVLPAGTKFAGKVETSPTDPRKSRPLTVNLTAVLLGDRTTPVKTAGAFTIQQKGWTTARRGIAVSAGGFIAPAGTKVQFRLAQPLNL